MPRTVQIRNIDDEVYDKLRARAAGEGLSVPEYLRQEAIRLVSRPSMSEWLASLPRRPVTTGTRGDTIAALDAHRGPWPGDDADR